MFTERIPINIDFEKLGIIKGNTEVRLDCYVSGDPAEKNEKRPAVIVLPGGGYSFLSPFEGEPIALLYAAQGFAAFVLWYSIYPAEFPAALLEVASAAALVRERADEWRIDPDRICVCGFSAGGHLAASAGTLWNSSVVRESLGFRNGENRINGMILSYPVISSKEFGNHSSIKDLLGTQQSDKELTAFVSLEDRVDGDTPPAFIWHTADDDVVQVENSLAFASAMAAQKRPFELHVFPRGPHGLALSDMFTKDNAGRPIPEVAEWMPMSARWIKEL